MVFKIVALFDKIKVSPFGDTLVNYLLVNDYLSPGGTSPFDKQ